MRRAKIVCTLGPATSSYEVVLQMVQSGMDVARINMSHGTHEQHSATIELVRRASDEVGRGVGVLADLQGPKIRLGNFANGSVILTEGQRFTITTEPLLGDAEICSTDYPGLADDARVGATILVDDGRINLRVVEVNGPEVVTEVVEGGPVSDHKGMNLPGAAVSVPALTERDREDLRWALNAGVDLIALSFVRSPDDVRDVHEVMDEVGIRRPVLAKLEKPQAVEALPQIVQAFDGLMVARGDLGVELPLQNVPLVQKRAIDLCRHDAKPVIVATQMLDSMIAASRPTRAEVSDVANAVLDGADALMLSGETSVGRDPAHVVDTMSRIISHIEEEALGELTVLTSDSEGSTARALTKAATQVGTEVGAAALCAFTETGLSPRLVARHRSPIPLLAFTPNHVVRSQLTVVWGVETFLTDKVSHTDQMVDQVEALLLQIGRAEPGEKVIMIAGVPPGVPGTTNGMRVHLMGSGSTGSRAEWSDSATQRPY